MLWEWANDRASIYILDLDGTLMPSAEIDNQCFWEAVFACFGASNALPDLHGFKHVTDTGILDEWCRLELGRPPCPDETVRIKNDFLQLLESAAARQPGAFKPLPGVIDWLDAASTDCNVYTGIATGGWERSARLKLQLSGLDRFNLPLASSDDAVARTDIMEIAAQKTFSLQPDLESQIAYVGDGLWDMEASRALGWSFIGIAADEQARKLKQAGAELVQADFRPTTA